MHELRPLFAIALITGLGLTGACKKKAEPQGGATGSADKAGGGGGGGGNQTGEGKGGGGGDGKGGGPAMKAIAVAAGASVSCALMDGGTVRCWGRSDYGDLGTGRVDGQAATAVVVPGVSGATQLVVGGDPGGSGDLGCALDGKQVWCWGNPGMFPQPKPADAPKPSELTGLAGATALSLGAGQGLALFPDGSVKGWGDNVFNAMGLGVDVKVDDDRAIIAIPGVADAVAIASGQNHGCAAHKDGTVTCWGYSRLKTNAVKVAGAVDVVALAAKAGGDDTCAITKAKTVLCWSGYKLEAAPLDGLTDVVSLSARTHFCAVKADGTAWCWDNNGRGQLGNGTTGNAQSKPQQVKDLTDAVQISTGAQTSCALRKTGQVACWGYNRYGQLGDGTLVDRSTPVLVKHLNDKAPAAPSDGLAEVQQFATKQAFDNLPAGCSHGPLDVTFRTLAGPFEVVSAYATNVDGKGLTYKVALANYQADPANLSEAARGKQLMLSMRFAKIDLNDKQTPMPIVPGVYSMDTKQDQLVYPSAADRASDNVMLGSISLEGMKAGEVELTKIGDGWICGEARLQTKDSKFVGKFAAQLVDKK